MFPFGAFLFSFGRPSRCNGRALFFGAILNFFGLETAGFGHCENWKNRYNFPCSLAGGHYKNLMVSFC